MIVPQDAAGDCTPIDRNDSADSVIMLSAIIRGANTISVVATLGRMSISRMRRRGTPSPSAASTNSLRLSCSTCPRIGRAT